MINIDTNLERRASFAPRVPKPLTKPILEYKIIDHLKTLYGMATNPITTLSAYQFQLPVFQYQIFGNHFTVLNDPDMIRHCFVENASNYTLEPIRQSILTPVLRRGLVAVEGDRWKRARRVLAPIFTPRFTKQFADRMADTVANSVPRVLADTSKPVLLSDLMSDLAYQVLSDTLFSGEISSDAAGMMSDVADFFQFLGNVDPLDILKAPHWLPRPTRLRGKKAVKRLRLRINRLTQDRLYRKDTGTDLPDDFLTRLINARDDDKSPLSMDDIEDHILTFIAAGHETTARGLSWMLFLLSKDPAARAQVETEIDKIDVTHTDPSEWMAQIPFTVACFEETMRLYPPAPFITRMARKDDRFGLAFIPAGGNLFLNLYALHRHEKLWDKPDHFIPDRFMGSAKEDIERFQYLPFGVGHRTCIGSHFAMQEALIILVHCLQAYRFDYVGRSAPCPVMRITLKPDNGIPMQVTKR